MGVIVNAIPKSGTHLLCRLLELLGMGRDGSVYLAPRIGAPAPLELDAQGLLTHGPDVVPIAATRCAAVSRGAFAEMAGRIASAPAHAFFEAHQLWSRPAADILSNNAVKVLIIMRDPRGAALSHADWMIDRDNPHDLSSLMEGASLRQRLAAEFFGLPREHDPDAGRLIPLFVRYRNMEPWSSYPHLYVTTYEALVGESGGGDPAQQRAEIEAIAGFVGRPVIDAGALQHGLWGDSRTFRRGLAERWRAHMDEFPDGVSDQVEEMLAIIQCMRPQGN